jgi:SAM-dependent methyltransferase
LELADATATLAHELLLERQPGCERNPDRLERVPAGAGRVLEVGCGNGNLGRAYLALNPYCEYFGVEISEDAAAEALLALHRVIVGDIERPDVLAMLDEALWG